MIIMYECVECGTEINSKDTLINSRLECPLCGIEHELLDERLVGLQLGPSEE